MSGSSPRITPGDLRGRTAGEIRELAARLGLRADPSRPDRFLDPVTGRERRRIDPGHIDVTTGRPCRIPRAAVPHVHGDSPAGPRSGKIIDIDADDAHFPLRQGDAAEAI